MHLRVAGIRLHPLDTGLHRRPILKVILQAANGGGVLALAEGEFNGHLQGAGGRHRECNRLEGVLKVLVTHLFLRGIEL
jgi:hypothetical protein